MALTISPSSASIDSTSNVLSFSAINNSSSELTVSVDLGVFTNIAVASVDSVVLPPNSSYNFKIGFYDNVFKKDNICIAELKGKEQVGANIKVCIEATVNTTGQASPSSESLAGIKGAVYFNSQRNMANQIFLTLSTRVESLKSSQLFAEYELAASKLNDLRQMLNSIDDAVISQNNVLAEKLLSDFLSKSSDLTNSLPIVTMLGQNTTAYFTTNDTGQTVMYPERIPEMDYVLRQAGVTDKNQINIIKDSRDKVEISRTVQVLEIKDPNSRNSRNQTNIRLFLKNNTSFLMNNVVLLEAVPSELLQGMSNMTAYYGFNLIRENPPVFELYVGDLEPGVLKEVSYKVYNKINFDNVNLFKLPVVSRQGVRQLQLGESEMIVTEFKTLLENKKVELAAKEAELEAEKQSRASYWPYIALVLLLLLCIVAFITNKTLSKIHKEMHEMSDKKG